MSSTLCSLTSSLAAGGMLAAVIMTPVDVCKTRIMTGTGAEYISLPQTFVKVLACVSPPRCPASVPRSICLRSP